jgi:hypothetical protein
MPERGEIYNSVPAIDATGQLVDDDPVWIPYVSVWEHVIVPEELRDGDSAVLLLPTVKAFGPDMVCQQYAWIATRRVETGRKSYVLGPDDSISEIQAQVGGTPRMAIAVMQLVGDTVDTDDGPAYPSIPCFRFRLPLQWNGETQYPLWNFIGWLVHHPNGRASKLDHDWQHQDAADRYQARPRIEVRLDGATSVDGMMVAPVMGEAPTGPVAPAPSFGVDVLPGKTVKKRGLFRRG